MTELYSIIEDQGGQNEQLSRYIVAPCDGYYNYIEICNIDNGEATENIFTYFGPEINVNSIQAYGVDQLNPINITRGFYLQSASAEGNAKQDPSSQVTRKHYGKRRLYVKGGQKILHYVYNHGSAGISWSHVRAKFNPQPKSVVQWRIREEAMDSGAAQTYGSRVQGAYALPISLMPGSIVKWQVNMISTSTTGNVDGQLVFRHLKPSRFVHSASSPTGQADDSSFSATTEDLQTLDREILAIELISCPDGEIRTMQGSFIIPQSFHESDLLTYSWQEESSSTTFGSDLVMEIHGRASGYTNYQHFRVEGSYVEDISEVRD